MLDTVSYGYDANGRLKTTSLPCSVTWEATCPDIAVTRTYDALDRPLQAVDKGGGTATYTYQGNDVLVAIGPAPSGENEKK
jgi:YD repeat-containing protein